MCDFSDIPVGTKVTLGNNGCAICHTCGCVVTEQLFGKTGIYMGHVINNDILCHHIFLDIPIICQCIAESRDYFNYCENPYFQLEKVKNEVVEAITV